jgi:heme/copper-type cytochrome/quinol oxidase subunit 3
VARSEHTGGVWPPEGVEVFDAFDLPFLNTLILLLSGCTVTWAHHALIHGDRQGLLQGLALTILLGALFTAIQAYEYSHAAFGFTDGIYSSTFYMATGFHGFHVIVGTIFLIVCFFRAYGPLQAGPSFRLRGGGLVLALRRRGLAVPLRLRLLVGRQLIAEARRTGPIRSVAGWSPR